MISDPYQSKEKDLLVRAESSLGLGHILGFASGALGGYRRGGAQLFDELSRVSLRTEVSGMRIRKTDLLQRFVVDKTCRIFREIQLSALDLLAELPASVSVSSGKGIAYSRCSTHILEGLSLQAQHLLCCL